MSYAWNLRDDWPVEYLPADELGDRIALFSEPLSDDEVPAGVSLDEADDGTKTLQVDATLPGTRILAMVPGSVLYVEGAPSRLLLETHVFDSAATSSVLSSKDLFPIIWFENWLVAGRIPRKIIYENVEPTLSLNPDLCTAGMVIGQTTNAPLRIRIEYADSTEDAPKFMHPVEFFSLLFWRQESDPCFNDNPPDPPLPSDSPALHPYTNELLRKMMLCREGGQRGAFGDDDWLGLKPPLRTYQRVEWEARKAHIFHHDNWQNPGSLSGIIENPLILNRGYQHQPKCNIFAGEMAFRSGFRVPTIGAGDSALRYQVSEEIQKAGACAGPSDAIFNVAPIEPRGNLYAITRDGKTYEVGLPFCRKRYVEGGTESVINGDIQDGKVILFARKRFKISGVNKAPHTIIVAELDCVRSNTLGPDTLRFDQHCERSNIPIGCQNRVWCGYENLSTKAFVELIPGGDPTEDWGVEELNCLVCRSSTP